ncbi:MAG: hypothetical protein IPP57_06615 [Candidatus Obscuribacter sp.]|nr:hypothetical protein [Candidatus Obscuribacter sp.]
MLIDDTIAAISTPSGVGAIAIVRLSGPDAFLIAQKIFVARKKSSENNFLLTKTGSQRAIRHPLDIYKIL